MMRYIEILLFCFTLILICIFTALANSNNIIIPLDTKSLPKNMALNNVNAKPFLFQGKTVIRVDYKVVDWPNVFFTPARGVWNWSDSAGMAVDIYNPESKPVSVNMRVDNAGGDGFSNCTTVYLDVPSKRWATMQLNFGQDLKYDFWGMRGVPGGSSAIDPSRITAFQLFLPMPKETHTLYISNIRLIPRTSKAITKFSMPFIDRFGQYIHADWPGKIHSENDFAKQIAVENKAIISSPILPDRDKFGGWASGPQLNATGWFRTQKVDGRWWLVTPNGHLFFSIGIDTIHPNETTFIDGRDNWFEGLPDPNGIFKEAYGYMNGATYMAEKIGGKGRTFAFYQANQIRKYGADWKPMWCSNVYKRLPSWGFNTIANWSDPELLDKSPMPFVVATGVGGNFRYIEGAKGYWGRMPDVYDPAYTSSAAVSVDGATRRYGSNPLCIGYFVDNEIAWETIEKGTLASPIDQPCRQAFVAILKAKYSTIENLNKAWETDAASWDVLQSPAKMNEQAKEDTDAYVYDFAKRYFTIIKNALKINAPNQLYLGCRFAWSHPQAIKACADVVDVVSFNLYRKEIVSSDWTGKKDLGKPIIIGEFHFGALDRGMFHTGLVPTNNQNERAASFAHYVKTVAECPSFVGCHWFQYADEPTTGRWFDGENYNIGFVNTADVPYPEMVKSARKINSQIYQLHSKAAISK